MRCLGAAILLLAGYVELSNGVECKKGKPEELVRRINQIYKTAKDSGNYGKGDKSIEIDNEKTTITPAQLADPSKADKSYTIECPEQATILVITANNPEDDLFKFEIYAKMDPNKASPTLLLKVNEKEQEKLDNLKLSNPSKEDLQAATASIMAMIKAGEGNAGWSDVKMNTCIRRIKVDFGKKKPVVIEVSSKSASGSECKKAAKVAPQHATLVETVMHEAKYVWYPEGFTEAMGKTT